MCLWKNWNKPKTKIRNLIQLGVPEWKAYEWGNTGRVIGVFQIVQYYTEPLVTPIGETKG